jgi:hypothetical protein
MGWVRILASCVSAGVPDVVDSVDLEMYAHSGMSFVPKTYLPCTTK